MTWKRILPTIPRLRRAFETVYKAFDTIAKRRKVLKFVGSSVALACAAACSDSADDAPGASTDAVSQSESSESGQAIDHLLRLF